MAPGATGPLHGSAADGFASGADAAAHVLAAELGEHVVVDGADGHHLERVRRLRTGERVTVADGAGRWRCYSVTAAARGRLDLVAEGAVRAEPRLAPGLGVAFALSKGAKPEQIVAGLTELGVDRIVPFRSARSVVRWDHDRVAAATERWRRVAREAAMQCRRSRLPLVAEPVALADLPADAVVVLGDPAGRPAAEIPLPAGGEWLAVVGAEGGLDDDERAVLVARPGTEVVAVGPHILRAETAALALGAALATRRVTTQRDEPGTP
jgi:16S rRNA (uracil1498-N3)-methyltransferase